jgi:hypothetical protein
MFCLSPQPACEADRRRPRSFWSNTSIDQRSHPDQESRHGAKQFYGMLFDIVNPIYEMYHNIR